MPRTADSDFISESQKEVNVPVNLFILKPDPTDSTNFVYVTDYYKDLVFDGNTYSAVGGIKREDIKNDPKTIPTCNISLSNVNFSNGRYVTNNLNYFVDPEIVIYTSFVDDDTDTVISYITDEFIVNGCNIDGDNVSFDCSSPGVFNDTLPRLIYYKKLCRFYFKDTNCGYTGTESPCNRRYSTCRIKERFGGVYLIKSIKYTGAI